MSTSSIPGDPPVAATKGKPKRTGPAVARVSSSSAASDAAHVLRETILSSESDAPEWFLGSEDELVSALGVSRPTLRQALRILELEQLITVRRGVGGGIFALHPSVEGVAQTASVYLRAENTTYGDVIATIHVLATQCARLAASNPDADARREVATFYDERLSDGVEDSLPRTTFAALTGEFQVLLARVSGSKTLILFMSVLVDLAVPAAAHTIGDVAHMRQMLENHRSVAEAVLRGDPDLAAERMAEHIQGLLELSNEATALQALYPHTAAISQLAFRS